MISNIEQATAQYNAVTGVKAHNRRLGHARRAVSPTATHVRDNASGREGIQVDMFSIYLVIQFNDGETELRDADDVTLIERPNARY